MRQCLAAERNELARLVMRTIFLVESECKRANTLLYSH